LCAEAQACRAAQAAARRRPSELSWAELACAPSAVRLRSRCRSERRLSSGAVAALMRSRSSARSAVALIGYGRAAHM
jgi:hypothetical protein